MNSSLGSLVLAKKGSFIKIPCELFFQPIEKLLSWMVFMGTFKPK
jgi:hypothetical protein